MGDGGVDAYVKNSKHSIDEVIPIGDSAFQIKSSDLQPNQCKEELHIDNNLNQPLKPMIEDILENDGTYILVLFANITNQKEKNRLKAINEELNRIGFLNPKIRLYSANQLQGFIEKYPSLITWLKSDIEQCQHFSSWAENRDIKIPSQYVFDEERTEKLSNLQNELKFPNGECKIFRVVGLSGIGKTRFVFEALKTDYSKNRVLYTKFDQFYPSNLYNSLLNNKDLSGIIVIDECDLQSHNQIVKAFSSRGERLAFITLSQEIGVVPLPTKLYKMTQLDEEIINKILSLHATYLPKEIIGRLAHFADGYPYIGVLLADTYKASEEDQKNFLAISDDGLMNRLIGGDDTKSDHFLKTKRVLSGLSLFGKVRYSEAASDETKFVADLVGVDLFNFSEIVHEQIQRGIIQGHHYISVTPFMLRVYLINDWWKIHGFTKENFNDFIEKIPENNKAEILERFFGSIPYIATTDKGKEFTEAMLGPDGPFFDSELLNTKLGSSFFLELTSADPESALRCLQKTIGKMSIEELKNLTIGRREIIYSLQKIAIWENLFIDAALLLASLGEAENERWSNNASGVFSDLFSPATGLVASTEASPEKRFPVLDSLIHSKSSEMRKLVFTACKKALQVGHFSRTVGPEYQGVRKQPNLWTPSNRKEYIESYSRVWRLLYDNLEEFEENERNEIIHILLESIRGLSLIPELTDTITSDIEELAKKSFSNRKEIIEKLEELVHYGKKQLPKEILSKWDNLAQSLLENNFHSRLERFVGLSLLTDLFDENFEPTDKIEKEIEKLAEESLKNPPDLQAEFYWLTTDEAKNGYIFGYDLGLLDIDNSLLHSIITAQENTSDRKDNSEFFLSGYLKTIFERDKELWENLLDRLCENPKIVSLLPELTWRSGISDQAALRILKLAKRKQINPSKLRFFAYGSVIKNISEKVVIQWIEYLLSSSEESAGSIALEVTHAFFIRKDSMQVLPKDLIFNLLTHKSFIEKHNKPTNKTMDEFYWVKIGEKYIDLYPENSILLVNFFISNFGNDESFIGDVFSSSLQVINKITQQQSHEVWNIVAKYIGPPIDSRAFHINEWLRGNELYSTGRIGALSYFSTEDIWNWVDQDVENRARYIANLVPKALFNIENQVCWAREVLRKYGDREDVQNELMANFFTDSWTGPASLHFLEIKNKLLEFSSTEENDNVKKWINKIITSLDKQIKREEIEEELDY